MAKKIYVIGIRSCAPLASFLSFYLNLICENVVAVHTNSSSETFEQLIRIGEEDGIPCGLLRRWNLPATGRRR